MFEPVEIRNREIKTHLDIFVTLDMRCGGPSVPKGWDGVDFEDSCEYHTSDRTLREIVLPNPDAYGFARYKRIFGETPAGRYFFDNVGGILGYDQGLTSGYEPRGFVGWHLDNYLDAWCLMFVYTAKGDGWFKYYDREIDQIIKIDDRPGWTVKAGRLADNDVWHCARADSERWWLGLMYQDQNHWLRSIEILQQE